MMLRYGNLSFEMERIYRWDHRAVFDETGQDFLYDHIVIGCQCVLNPLATRSNAVTGKALGAGGAGEPGMTSLRDLRTYMMQPRLPLSVTIGRDEILASPTKVPGVGPLVCDAKGGPQPLAFNVVQFFGVGRTLLCNFEIETWINDFKGEGSPAILSNRWRVTHDIDELNYTTRTVAGRVVFRKDFISTPGFRGISYPDDFRARFNHPIPSGCKRDSVHVQQSADGTSVDYTFVDREQTLNLGRTNPVLKIKGTLTNGYSYQSITELPKVSVGLTVEVWGRRTSTRKDLVNACIRAAAAYGFDAGAGLPNLYESLDWSVNIVEKYARLQVSVRVSGATTLIWHTVRSTGRSAYSPPESIAGVATIDRDHNPRPPEGDGSRGGLLLRMVSQELSKPGRVPERPRTEAAIFETPLEGPGGY
jgi:hypothetical protein